MAGYWPSSFLGCLWTETEVHKLAKKKNEANTQSSSPKTFANKGFIIWLKGKFFSRDTTGNPGSASQSQRSIWFILIAYGAEFQLCHFQIVTRRGFCLYSWREISGGPLGLAFTLPPAEGVSVYGGARFVFIWMGTNMAAGNQHKHLSLIFAQKHEFISRGTRKQSNTFSNTGTVQKAKFPAK